MCLNILLGSIVAAAALVGWLAFIAPDVDREAEFDNENEGETK
jgi:hypothetical protein